MALSIKTVEADELARSLARLTGESMTEAITAACVSGWPVSVPGGKREPAFRRD
jgi:hypothetical protein